MDLLPRAVIQLAKTTVLLVTSPVFKTGTRPIKIQSVSIEQPSQTGIAALNPAMTPPKPAAVNTSVDLDHPSS